MHVHLKALGCRLNEAELEHWANGFRNNGHLLTMTPENADLIVINTCAVTSEAVKKSRQLIRRSQRANPLAKLVVSGCYASLAPDIDKEIDAIDLVVPNRDKDKLVEIIQQTLTMESMPSLATVPGESALFQRGRSRAFVKIQDGCRYRCTFCIVTVARGEERSRSIQDIITEINMLAEQDVKEVVLTGVHVGGYGSDINSDLYSLIRAILRETDIPRLRLASVEPWDLPDSFFGLFENSRLMPHIHLPLQSGSDVILKRMARRCRTQDFARLVETARSVVPDFNVTTDIIVGFPGETVQEWDNSIDFIKQIGFSHIHIFPYSQRAGTKAASMPEQVPASVKKMRCRQLHQIASQLKQRHLQEQIGKEVPVLFENIQKRNCRGDSYYAGYTDNYLRVQLPAIESKTIANEIIDVKLLGLTDTADALRATLD